MHNITKVVKDYVALSDMIGSLRPYVSKGQEMKQASCAG